MQHEASTAIPACPDPPVVRLHDRTADREPHPKSLRLAAHEVLEDSLELGIRHADSGVADRYRDTLEPGPAGADPDLAQAVRGQADSLLGIDQHVQQDLLK